MRRLNLIKPNEVYRTFWNVHSVSAERALIDKCDVVIGGWSFNATRFETSGCVRRLSKKRVYAGDGMYTRLFQDRTVDDQRFTHNIAVRGTGPGEGVEYPHPTFSGYFKLWEVNADRDKSNRTRNWEALFFAYLNLNRAIQAQDLSSSTSVRDLQGSNGHRYALAICERSKRRIRERLLTPADNILDRTSKRTSYAMSRPIEQHFSDHVEAIFQAIRQELPISFRDRDCSSKPTITFKAMEVCWDFFDEQPILTVLTLKNLVQSVAKTSIVRHFPDYRLSQGLEYDSPSVMLDVVDGVAIRLYAKSETTVRIEVVYSQSAIKTVASLSGIQSLANALNAIRSVKRDAANKLNALLSVVREFEASSKNHATVDELVDTVIAVAGNPQRGVALLARLAANRRICPYPRSPLYRQLRELKQRGVLKNEKRSPNGRNYVVTPVYEQARSKLLSSYLVPDRGLRKPKKRTVRRRLSK